MERSVRRVPTEAPKSLSRSLLNAAMIDRLSKLSALMAV